MPSAYRVISLRRRWPHAVPEPFVYVGRAWAGLFDHPLGNPFRRDDPRSVEKYAEWLKTLPNLDHELVELRADTECGRMPLACWCGDGRVGSELRCHAMVLASLMARMFPQDQEGLSW